MKFGYFDDEQREYVITTPKTPLPWINYLGHFLVGFENELEIVPRLIYHRLYAR